jgi:hypothetical protein
MYCTVVLKYLLRLKFLYLLYIYLIKFTLFVHVHLHIHVCTYLFIYLKNRDAHQDLAKIGDLSSSSDRIK